MRSVIAEFDTNEPHGSYWWHHKMRPSAFRLGRKVALLASASEPVKILVRIFSEQTLGVRGLMRLLGFSRIEYTSSRCEPLMIGLPLTPIISIEWQKLQPILPSLDG